MNQVQIHLPPMSVNKAWKGRRFKTDIYKKFERDVLLMLPHYEIPEGRLGVKIQAGFASAASDIDNIAKPILDILQKRYKFNDNRVYKLELEKKVTGKKGSGYFNFCIWGIV
jgi:Holliday junction resolvase RusA-like endonuclease